MKGSSVIPGFADELVPLSAAAERAPVDPEPDLKCQQGYGRVFADSRAAVEALWRKGLPRNVTIWTSAPSLHLDPEVPTRPVDDLGRQSYAKLAETTRRISDTLHAAATEAGTHPNLAFAIARVPLIEEHLLYRGMMLRAEDVEKPCIVADVDIRANGGSGFQNHFNAPWRQVLPLQGPNAPSVFSTVVDKPESVSVPGQVEVRPGLVSRLNFEPASSVVYRLARDFSRLIGEGLWSRNCWLLGVSPLGKELSGYLVRSGFLPRMLTAQPAPENKVANEADAVTNAVLQGISEDLSGTLVNVAPGPVAERINSALEDSVRDAVLSYCRWREGWRTRLESGNIAGGKHRAVLRYDVTPRGLSAAEILEERGVPYCVGQHGVTSEIRQNLPSAPLTQEAALGGIFCAYGPENARLAREDRYTRARCASVGVSADMTRLKVKSKRRGRPEILYVSTGLHLGNRQRPSLRGVSDIDLTLHELRVLDEVLTGLPSGVVYKTYPFGNRYLDPDPVVERATYADNVRLLEQTVDVRYILSSYRMLVTSRATSTFGWCLATGRPLVLLDHPDHNPFRAELRALLSDGLFYFDLSRDDGFRRARALLRGSSDEVETLWAEKAAPRARLIQMLLGDLDGAAGKRVAALLSSENPR